MKEIKTFRDILDTQKPDWWLVYATQQELIDCVRQCTDGHSGTVAAKDSLRKSVHDRIFDIGRAALQWELQTHN